MTDNLRIRRAPLMRTPRRDFMTGVHAVTESAASGLLVLVANSTSKAASCAALWGDSSSLARVGRTPRNSRPSRVSLSRTVRGSGRPSPSSAGSVSSPAICQGAAGPRLLNAVVGVIGHAAAEMTRRSAV
jgi:hypothetical protein